MQYFTALDAGDVRTLETAWPGDVVIYDPRAGEVRGHKELRRFVKRNQSRLAGLKTRSEPVASTTVGSRAVVELLAHLTVDGQPMSWPVAVVVESPDDRSVVFRTYCSQLPLGREPARSGRRYSLPVLSSSGMSSAAIKPHSKPVTPTPSWTPSSPDGYVREPIGPHAEHRGTDELRAFYAGRCRRRGHRPRALREHRRRRALRPRVQLRPLGQSPCDTPSGYGRLRTRPGRLACRGALLRRRRGAGLRSRSKIPPGSNFGTHAASVTSPRRRNASGATVRRHPQRCWHRDLGRSLCGHSSSGCS